MNREINIAEFPESEFLELIGLDYEDMVMEDNGHDNIHSGTQIQGIILIFIFILLSRFV